MKVKLEELISKLTNTINGTFDVQSFNKLSDGAGLVELSANDFDITKPFFIIKNTGGYASTPYQVNGQGSYYYRLTDYVGSNQANTYTTVTVCIINR